MWKSLYISTVFILFAKSVENKNFFFCVQFSIMRGFFFFFLFPLSCPESALPWLWPLMLSVLYNFILSLTQCPHTIPLLILGLPSLLCSYFRRTAIFSGLAQLVVACQYNSTSFFIHHPTKHLVRSRKRALASEDIGRERENEEKKLWLNEI